MTTVERALQKKKEIKTPCWFHEGLTLTCTKTSPKSTSYFAYKKPPPHRTLPKAYA